MSTSMREALKPCPFCGGPASRYTDRMPMVECESIDCFGPRTTAGTIEDAVAQWNTRAALSSPAPDRLSEAERASIESARKALSAYRETLSDGQLIAFPDLLEKSIAIIDRLSRQPEAEPAAWGDSEGRERPIDAGAMKQLRLNPTTEAYWSRFSIPLYISPRLDRERDRVFGQMLDALKLIRMYVKEGGVPRYTVTPGAGLNSAIEESIDPAIEAADSIMREARAALASHVEQEPVAWRWRIKGTDRWHYYDVEPTGLTNVEIEPLYAHPTPSAEEERHQRHGEHLFKKAKESGWLDDGEGAFEFIVRKAYEAGARNKGPTPSAEAIARLVEYIGNEARRYASHYPLHSDGSNTFVMFAEWVEKLDPAAIAKLGER